jgi:hypothetical protein
MSKTELQLLKEKLDKGFFVRNLFEMAKICENLMKDNSTSPVFYILRSIFLDIAKDWDDRTLPVKKALEIENKLKITIRATLDELDTHKSRQALFESMVKLVAASR